MADTALKNLITKVLKVPPQPEAPLGSPGSVRIFNAAPGYYRYRIGQWVLGQIGKAAGLAFGLAFLNTIEVGPMSFFHGFIQPLEVLGVLLFLGQMPFTFMMVDLDYRYRWYMITDTSLRIREGLLVVRERTMTFANIQNLSLRQGPLQRMLGIADLRVRTAGGGGGEGPKQGKHEVSESANMHLGYFRGVDNAEEIRDVIMDRMRGLTDTGLGNPDEAVAVVSGRGASFGGDRELLAAARELLAETRRLRSVIEQ
ncbi:MAG: PH domain-containing protein [Thermoanaerobaculales bacterium]